MQLRRLRDDSGMAMVTAVMAGLVVLALSAAGFSLAKHSLESSGANRRDVQSVHAAEAGLDRFLDYLATQATIAAPACWYPLPPQAAGATESLGTEPVTTFTVSASYYSTTDGTGTALGDTANCPATFASIPKSVVIRSIGTSGTKTRTMETMVELSPNAGSSLSPYAVEANGVATWTGQAAITNAAGIQSPANLYSNSNLELKGGGVVQGQVEAQGFITLSGATEVKKFVTAKQSVSVSNNAIVRGDARSGVAGLTNGGLINGSAYYCTGSVPGGTVSGTKVQECKANVPPVRTFPTFTYDAAAWSNTENSVVYNTSNTFTSCSTAQTWLDNVPTGNYVARINASCSLTLPKIEMKGSLAIISNGDVVATGSSAVTRSTTDPTWTLSLMSNILNTPAVIGGPTCSSNSGMTFVAGMTFPTKVDVLFYTPCDVKFTGNANASIQGQIIGGRDVTFSSGSNISYTPIIVPGNNPIGFRESVRYRSEIID